MIIIIYLLIFANAFAAEFSSVPSKSDKNDLISTSKTHLVSKDANSLKIISTEPFVIQLGVFSQKPTKKEKKEKSRRSSRKRWVNFMKSLTTARELQTEGVKGRADVRGVGGKRDRLLGFIDKRYNIAL